VTKLPKEHSVMNRTISTATILCYLQPGELIARNFELLARDFYLSSQKSAMLLSKGFFKTASNGSRTAFFDGLKSRQKIEINGFFKMHLRATQTHVFTGIFLKLGKMAERSKRYKVKPARMKAFFQAGIKYVETSTGNRNLKTEKPSNVPDRPERIFKWNNWIGHYREKRLSFFRVPFDVNYMIIRMLGRNAKMGNCSIWICLLFRWLWIKRHCWTTNILPGRISIRPALRFPLEMAGYIRYAPAKYNFNHLLKVAVFLFTCVISAI
jgi:hypothetical protein